MDRITRGKTRPLRHQLWLEWFSSTFLESPQIPFRIIVDLGFGEKPFGTIELFNACSERGYDVQIVGLETSEHRLRAARDLNHPYIEFIHGGLDALHGQSSTPLLVRALNVLRQYPPIDVPSIRRSWLHSLPADATLTEGTTDRDGNVLAMWRLQRGAPAKLVFGATGRHGFAPNQLLAALPCDLRWQHPKPLWLRVLFQTWTEVWQTTNSEGAPLRRFTESVQQFRQSQPTWVSSNDALWSAGLVEFNTDNIVADIGA